MRVTREAEGIVTRLLWSSQIDTRMLLLRQVGAVQRRLR